MPSPLPFESDPELVAAFDAASFWLLSAAFQACMGGVSLSTYLGSQLPRLHTSYYPKAERTAADALAFRECLRTPRPRVTAADKAKAQAAKSGFVNGRFVGAVAA